MESTKLKKAETLEEALNVLGKDALSSIDVLESFYVDTNKVRNAGTSEDQINMMAIAIRNSKTPCHMLFSGHIGSGKSTELRRLEKKLTDDKYIAGVAECHTRLNMSAMEYTDVMLFVLETLLSRAIDYDLDINRIPLERIKEYWGTNLVKTSESAYEATTGIYASVEAQSPPILSFVFKIVAGLRTALLIQSKTREEFQRKVQPELHLFIAMINEVIAEIQKAGVKKGYKDALPVVLLDGLEKTNRDIADKLFRDHSQELVRLHAHMVLAFPVSLCYTPEYRQIKNNYASDWRLPMIKLRTWNGRNYGPYPSGLKTLTEIVERRLAGHLYDSRDLKLIIKKTGGSLRDLFEALYIASLNALGGERGAITKKDVDAALKKMKSGISERFPQELIPKMIEIINGKKNYASDAELTILLQSSAVLEYNGEEWVDVHPLAADWIKKTQNLEAAN